MFGKKKVVEKKPFSASILPKPIFKDKSEEFVDEQQPGEESNDGYGEFDDEQDTQEEESEENEEFDEDVSDEDKKKIALEVRKAQASKVVEKVNDEKPKVEIVKPTEQQPEQQLERQFELEKRIAIVLESFEQRLSSNENRLTHIEAALFRSGFR